MENNAIAKPTSLSEARAAIQLQNVPLGCSAVAVDCGRVVAMQYWLVAHRVYVIGLLFSSSELDFFDMVLFLILDLDCIHHHRFGVWLTELS